MTQNHFDVIIVGAGISGIDAAYHVQAYCRGKTYAILGRARAHRRYLGSIPLSWNPLGFRHVHPGLFVSALGRSKAIAHGGSILKYINDTAKDYGVDRNIRLHHQVVRASWSSKEALWTVEAECGPERQTARFSCNFLFICSGYYGYVEGYTPVFPGEPAFRRPTGPSAKMARGFGLRR